MAAQGGLRRQRGTPGFAGVSFTGWGLGRARAYLFQGREYSWATGLYYFRARWYDPVTGRWLSNDPIGINGGLNQFVAFDNNPVMLTDAFGLCPEDSSQTGVVGAGIQGYLDYQAGFLGFYTSQLESYNQLANRLFLSHSLPPPIMSWMTDRLHQSQNVLSQRIFGKSAQEEGVSHTLGKFSAAGILMAASIQSGEGTRLTRGGSKFCVIRS